MDRYKMALAALVIFPIMYIVARLLPDGSSLAELDGYAVIMPLIIVGIAIRSPHEGRIPVSAER